MARLSDAELAGRLDAAWQAYEAASKPTWWSASSGWSFRGPIRHPRAYRFLALLQGANGNSLLDPLFALVFSSKKYEPWIGSRGPFRRHLSLCEIKDITDEIERRLNDRNKGTA